MTPIDGSKVEGAHMDDPALSRVVLFSKTLDGSPPVGPVLYEYPDRGATLNLILDLQPGSTYDLRTGIDGGIDGGIGLLHDPQADGAR